jgi:AI-2 transport protein TqsA
MAETKTAQVGSRLLLTIACLIILIAGLQAAESVVVPFLLAVFLSMIGTPPLVWLRGRGMPNALALLIVVLGFVFVLVGIGALLGGSVNSFTQTMPLYQARFVELLETTEAQIASWEFLENWGVSLELSTVVGDFINPLRLLDYVGTLISGVVGFVSDFFLVSLMMIFMLTEASGLPAKVKAALGDGSGKLLQFSSVMTQVHRYLIIKTGISLFTGLVLGTWVAILGVDFPILWGLLAFLLNYIPNIGSILAAVPPVLVSLIQPEGGLTLMLLVAAGYATVNIGMGNFIEPTLMGQRLGLSTLVVFLSLVFWGWVWGGVGMLLSVPLTMVVKILLQNSDEFRWIAVLLDKSPKVEARPAG